MAIVRVGAGAPVSDAGMGLPLFMHNFETTNISTDKFAWNTNTGTTQVTQSSTLGFVLNSGSAANAVLPGTYASVVSRRSFATFRVASTAMECTASFAGCSDVNSYHEIGLAIANTGNPYGEGVYFRRYIDASNNPQVLCVVAQNGSETTSPAIINGGRTFEEGRKYRLRIELKGSTAVFSVDGDVVATVQYSTVLPASISQLPFAAQVACAGTATTAPTISIFNVLVYARNISANKPWGHVQCGAGLNCITTPTGAAVAQTANWANSTVPATAALSNINAGYATLGGQFLFNAAAGAETDYALFVYRVPVTSTSSTGATLHVTGVRIGETVVTGVAVGANGTLISWFAGAGASAISLATTDASTTTVTNSSHKRIALGSQAFIATAPVGTVAPGFAVDFSSAPLVVPAGLYFSVGFKMPIGLATGSLVFRGTVTVIGYWE